MNTGALKPVIGDLEQLIRLTEEKYAYIYDCLPGIEQDVKLSIEEVEILLRHLLFNRQAADNTGQSVTVDTLVRILGEFQKVTDTFLDQELVTVLLRTFLDKSGDDRQSFYELIRVAREVEETLSVLRDIALNSMIFSIRIGEEGAGFQILSDRINHLSMGLGNQFRTMKDTINRLNTWNEDFQKKLVDFIDYEEDLKSKYQNRFQAELKRITDTLKLVCHNLENNLDNTKTAFADVARIMVLIQNQDIIRQNVENLIKCLGIVLERQNSPEQSVIENSLDYVVFANRVLELAKTLMANIETSLNESILSLGTLLAGMHDTVSDLETDAYYLGRLFAGEQNDPAAGYVLGEIFATVQGQVAELLDIKHHIDNKSSLLSEGRQTFIELMEMVENDFDVINKEARSLKKMKVLIKIELAHIDTKNDFALDSIISAVDQVIDTIKDNQQVFIKLQRFFLKNINEFNIALSHTQHKLALSAGTLAGSQTKLETISRLARGAVLASGREMQEVFGQLKEPWRHLADTDAISSLIEGIKTKLEQNHDQLQRMQAQLFRQQGITHWEEKAEDLKVLMEQFTCFVERKAMTAVTGSAVQDIGSDGGEITLF